jgi:hypothetical protein
VKHPQSPAADIDRGPILPKPVDVYDVTDDFTRPIEISQGCITAIMTLLGERLDRILFDEDHD